MPSRKNAAIMIDNGYLQKVLRFEYPQVQIDYLKFCEATCSKYKLDRKATYVFDGGPYIPNRSNEKEKRAVARIMKAHEDLRKLDRFTLKLGKQVPIFDERNNIVDYVQKGVDVLLAMEMVFIAIDPKKEIDHIVLISGDADFVPAVDFVRSRNVFMTNYHSGALDGHGGWKRASHDLERSCDCYDTISNNLISACRLIDRK